MTKYRNYRAIILTRTRLEIEFDGEVDADDKTLNRYAMEAMDAKEDCQQEGEEYPFEWYSKGRVKVVSVTPVIKEGNDND